MPIVAPPPSAVRYASYSPPPAAALRATPPKAAAASSAAATAVPHSVAADPAPTPAAVRAVHNYGDTLIGNPFGLRGFMADRGICFGGYLLNDTSTNLFGGKSTRRTINRSLVDLQMTLHTRRLFNWTGGKFVASMRLHFGPNGNNQQLGSIQGYSLIDYSPPATQLYELYYQQKLFDGHWTLRAGTMDANNIFDIPADAAIFVNPSAEDAPLYQQPAPPITAPGVVGVFNISPHTTLLAGAFYYDRFHPTVIDSMFTALEPINQPVGAFLTAEVDQTYQLSPRQPATIGIGGFLRTGQLPALAGGMQTDAGGGYMFIDQTLWQSHDTVHRLGSFFNVTGNDPRVSEIDASIQAGLVASGLVPCRDHDQMGVGVDWAHLSSLANTPKPYELVVEGFYAFSLGRGIVVQPDLQYFANTGGGVYPDSLIAMLRLNVNF